MKNPQADNRNTQQELLKANAVYTSLVENIPQILIRKDLNGVITYINQTGCKLFGKPYEELVGKTDFELFPHELAEKFVSDDRRLIETRETIDVTEENIDAQGKTIIFHTTKTPIVDENDNLVGLQIISWDVTKQREQEEKLKKSEEFTRAILDSLSSHIAILDEDGTIIHVNQAWRDYAISNCAINIKERNYFEGVNYLDLCRKVAETGEEESKDAVAVYHGIEDILSNHQVEFYYQYPCHSPTEKCWFNVKVTRLKLEDAKHVVVAHENITEQKKLEEMLYQTQKMEAVGQLASGIAHDFNNLHWIIKSNTQFLMMDMDPNSKANEDAQEIISTVERASALTKELITLSHRQSAAPQSVRIQELIPQFLHSVMRIAGKEIQVHTVLNPETKAVMIDPSQFEQIVLNLAINACEAMPEGGELTLAAGNVELDASDVLHHKTIAGGEFVWLSVKDSGKGMDEETKSKIFNPFFTTKDAGKGTGLGLSTVHGIVEQSGGFIEVKTEPGMGSEFKLYFPVSDKQTGNP